LITLREARQLAAAPEATWDALRERQEAWDRRRERWEDIRRHEAQAATHRRLAEEHHSKAAKLLTEVHST